LTLPEAFEENVYRQKWPDLEKIPNEMLRKHYDSVGEQEGRQANRLNNRSEFVRLIPGNKDALEIGPFCSPLLKTERTFYFDVLSSPALELRARQLGHKDPVAPVIHFVSAVGDLSVVNRRFDYVLSSHCVEHQPNLVAHLQQVARVLNPGGRYFLLIPDKRYCFDHFMNESTIADVLDAYRADRKVHLLKSVIEHRALTTHNDSWRHWAGDHGSPERKMLKVRAAVAEYEKAAGGYIDVHAWFFTPNSARILFAELLDIGLIELGIEQIYGTRRNANEFWLVLRK
jgi:SAM-dependent methyltransferase